MKNPAENELITGIAELFKDHQEIYEPGEWEAFSVYQKRKPSFIGQWIRIAAVFLILVSLLPFHLNDLAKIKKTNSSFVVVNKKNKNHSKTMPVTGKVTKPSSSEQIYADLNVHNSVTIPALAAVAVISANSPVVNKIQHQIKNPALVKTDLHEKNFMIFLQNEVKSTLPSVKQEKHSKWDFGVELLSTVLQSNVNIGAGVTTEYKLSENFSVASGIAFMQLETGKQYASNVNTFSTKRLLSVDANIQAIDIPITLTYNVNKQFYTSIGVSYFNVINEKRNNKYLTELPVSRTMKNPETEETLTTLTVLSGENNEPSNNLPLYGNSYLGFFNFSVGHKQEIFNRYKIVVEPFIKIPVGKLSNEDLKLTNGGVKLRFSF